VAIIATSPLTTDEIWTELESGQLILFDEGLPYMGGNECAQVELNGHGLSTKASDMLPHEYVDLSRSLSSISLSQIIC